MRAILIISALAALMFGVAIASARVSDEEKPQTFKGLTAWQWHVRYAKEHKALTKHGRMLRDERRGHFDSVRRLTRELAVRGQSEPIMAIRFVFGPYAEQAIRVAACETGNTFSVNATNGQYLGLFQMGDYARGRYGHGPTAIEQAKYAYRYFAAAGFDWSPWECKP